jgi:hypothetical protein
MGVMGLLLACAVPVAIAAELRPKTVESWQRYVQAVEARIDRELASTSSFLVLDFVGPGTSAEERKAILAGEIPVSRMSAFGANAEELDVPGGTINHWRGAVFVPGVTLDQVLSELRSPADRRHKQEDVLESRVTWLDEDRSHVYLKLMRKKIVTVTYNTEHDVVYKRLGPSKAMSRSVSTKIAELEEAGTPRERERPIGQDRGFMWRLNSYWRYEQVAGGVIVELESLTLSRDIPFLVKLLAKRYINSIARESINRTLLSVRDRVVAAAAAKSAEASPRGGSPR